MVHASQPATGRYGKEERTAACKVHVGNDICHAKCWVCGCIDDTYVQVAASHTNFFHTNTGAWPGQSRLQRSQEQGGTSVAGKDDS